MQPQAEEEPGNEATPFYNQHLAWMIRIYIINSVTINSVTKGLHGLPQTWQFLFRSLPSVAVIKFVT